MLRRWNRVAFSCRTVDFIALMTAMTLLLAHLDRYQSPQADDFLAAQALGDRAMIEQAQEHMEELDRLNADPLCARSARLLRRLLAIEARAADGENFRSAQAVHVQNPENESKLEATHSDGKHVYIPYFDIIQAAGEIVSAAATAQPSTRTVIPPGPKGSPQTRPVAAAATTPSRPAPDNNVHGLPEPSVSGVLSDDPMQLFGYPGMAGVEDEAFQDMDLAFLDNLMRGAGRMLGVSPSGQCHDPRTLVIPIRGFYVRTV
ncbi:hypothetical protein BDW72DRAFT_198193 [Aspergillus terricola var. indicus]